jgi:hypothetical protein
MAVPAPLSRQAPCFIIGAETLPEETVGVAADLASTISCNFNNPTLSGVPDVSINGLTFSSINFATSDLSPLDFALQNFAGVNPLANSDLQTFEDQLNLYLATEAGIRSVGGNLGIKVPKFFLEFQVSRIQTAQGNPPTDAGLQVDHLRDKVLKNAGGEGQELLDEVTRLATVLS